MQAVSSASTQLLQPLLAFASGPHMAVLPWRSADTDMSATPVSNPGPCTTSRPIATTRRPTAPSLAEEMLESPVTVSKPVRPGEGSCFRMQSNLGLQDLATDTELALARAAVLYPGHDIIDTSDLADSNVEGIGDAKIAEMTDHQGTVFSAAVTPVNIDLPVRALSAVLVTVTCQAADCQQMHKQSPTACSPADAISLSSSVADNCCTSQGTVKCSSPAVLHCTAVAGLQQSGSSSDLQAPQLPAAFAGQEGTLQQLHAVATGGLLCNCHRAPCTSWHTLPTSPQDVTQCLLANHEGRLLATYIAGGSESDPVRTYPTNCNMAFSGIFRTTSWQISLQVQTPQQTANSCLVGLPRSLQTLHTQVETMRVYSVLAQHHRDTSDG